MLEIELLWLAHVIEINEWSVRRIAYAKQRRWSRSDYINWRVVFLHFVEMVCKKRHFDAIQGRRSSIDFLSVVIWVMNNGKQQQQIQQQQQQQQIRSNKKDNSRMTTVEVNNTTNELIIQSHSSENRIESELDALETSPTRFSTENTWKRPLKSDFYH